jgi:hypothetical protein
MVMIRRLVLAAAVITTATGLLGCGSSSEPGPMGSTGEMSSASQDVLYAVSAPPHGLLACRVVELDAVTGEPKQPKPHFCRRLVFLPGFVVFEETYSHGLPEGRSTALAAGAVHSLRWEVSDVRIQPEAETGQ